MVTKSCTVRLYNIVGPIQVLDHNAHCLKWDSTVDATVMQLSIDTSASLSVLHDLLTYLLYLLPSHGVPRQGQRLKCIADSRSWFDGQRRHVIPMGTTIEDDSDDYDGRRN